MQQSDQVQYDLPSNSSELMLQISQCHNLMLLDKAYEIVQFYMTRHNQDKDNFPINKDLFHEIQTFHKEATFLKQQLSDNKDWIHDCNTQYFQMSYKFIPNSTNVALKFESVMKLPIINACALIYQTELFNNWVPFCKVSKGLKTPGLGHKICYIMMDLPVLSNREAYIRGYGVDKLEQSKSFLICCQTIHHDKEYQALHQINTTQVNCVQVEINFFAVEVTLINAGEFVMKSVANLDPKMKFIPQTVMNFLMKKIGKFMYERFCKLAQNIKGTQWEKAIQEQPQFYEHVRKRFEQYLSKY
ncbi:unnamed protein product (macronuclear) [Paramecium tetraurelia]|uniref:START domain-containing protein n=1 Tax=Paramecium tetraurelia TaxID=5888 RepID=A0CZT3_PARTE|nr:uncharacterized protein GSPATT00011873001 [Paramecium tetraurelia]CAK76300.1 unnamed protein product [Paramecium tetraurelia]|eukprot:XP_001443697.1 hypothetical protein (macronuclear) [Paramecium tetraurelia strain d4-2]